MFAYTLRDIGTELKRRRTELALTQTAAANLTGVSQRLWSECERGERRNVSFETVLRMLHTLGLDIDLVQRGKPAASLSTDPAGVGTAPDVSTSVP